MIADIKAKLSTHLTIKRLTFILYELTYYWMWSYQYQLETNPGYKCCMGTKWYHFIGLESLLIQNSFFHNNHFLWTKVYNIKPIGSRTSSTEFKTNSIGSKMV